MDLKDLSSNWKKLQETLKKDTSKPPKRRDVLQPQRNGVKRPEAKRRLLTAKNKFLTSEMGITSLNPGEKAPSASLALWAEDNDIPAADIAAAYGISSQRTSIPDTKYAADKINEGLSPTAEAGKYIALDCEMVGVGPDPSNDSALARVSIVNYHGHQLYDSFVLPKEAVTDYRTHVSGITPALLRTARSFEAVQADVAKLLGGKILVGHAVKKDLAVLMLGHPKRDIRDTSKYPVFRQLAGGKTPSLKKLAKEVLGVDIQGGEHSSVEDARATVLLFKREKDGFEREHLKRRGPGAKEAEGKGAGSKKKSREKKVKK
ncbi:Ribonuclease H-like domain [Lasallia pustulata]|uniref:RNA exonuclease 4 n=1 Tax=Lasallia pustulata TaxID=136370 RepID=A0A1W5CZN7_9LECA|nr:Ribonuclease H-like domain [Lasallia pustulata]